MARRSFGKKSDEPVMSREDYTAANHIIKMIHASQYLTLQEKRTLRGQALHGDVEGARLGYENLLARRGAI